MVISGLLVAGFLICSIAFIVARWYNRPTNFPPGPRGFPILGMAPFLGNYPEQVMSKYIETYGNIMSFRMGLDDFVILSSLDSVNEALLHKGEQFSGRPVSALTQELTDGHGIVFKDSGPDWKAQKKFGMAALRRLGMGCATSEKKIIFEFQVLAHIFESNQNEPIDILAYLLKVSCNITLDILCGRRFDFDDPKLRAILDTVPEKSMLMYIPMLRHIPPFQKVFQKSLKRQHVIIEIVKKIVEEHEDNLLDILEGHDFVDEYLLEMKKGNAHSSFKRAQLYQYIIDLLVGGIDSSKASLGWGILCLMHYPDTQAKIQEEIDRVIGTATPSMSHLRTMHYLRAFMEEVYRFKTIAPLDLPHSAKSDTTLCGYHIPKDTIIMANLWWIHNDPQVWGDPENFRPERHLTEDGQFVKSRHVIPFAVGYRRCLGEQQARDSIFLFYVIFLQKFSFICDTWTGLPPMELDLTAMFSAPVKYMVMAELRC